MKLQYEIIFKLEEEMSHNKPVISVDIVCYLFGILLVVNLGTHVPRLFLILFCAHRLYFWFGKQFHKCIDQKRNLTEE